MNLYLKQAFILGSSFFYGMLVMPRVKQEYRYLKSSDVKPTHFAFL